MKRRVGAPISPPCMMAARTQRASAAASESPRLSPCPASGCMMCAASPMSAVRLPIYASAWRKRSGKDAMVPGWMLATSGGSASAPWSGMPTLASSAWTLAEASAEWDAIACACSRNAISARRSSGEGEEASSRRAWR